MQFAMSPLFDWPVFNLHGAAVGRECRLEQFSYTNWRSLVDSTRFFISSNR